MSRLRASTSDLLPTVCAITGQPLPDRPLDGLDLIPLIDGRVEERPAPLFFWEYPANRLKAMNLEPYLNPELQKGTTPLVKIANGIATRNFTNFHHPPLTPEDYTGARAVVDQRYKLVVHEKKEGGVEEELFDLIEDPGETRNLIKEKPDVAELLGKTLREWQGSVLKSLGGADYGG